MAGAEILTGLIAEGLGIRHGTCDSGMGASTTAIVCADLAGFGNDYFNTKFYMQVLLNANSVGNAPEPQVRQITDYVSTTGTFTVTAFGANVEENDKIVIMHESIVAIGRDDADNTFDSSNVVSNANGSNLERLEYLATQIAAISSKQTVSVTEQEAIAAGEICISTDGGFIPESSLTEVMPVVNYGRADASAQIGGDDLDFTSCMQGATRVICAYRDVTNSNYLTIRIIELNSDRTVKEVGEEFALNAIACDNISVCDTGNSTFVVSMRRDADSKGYAHGCSATGVSVQHGEPFEFSDGSTIVSAVSASHDLYAFVHFYYDATDTDVSMVAGTINPVLPYPTLTYGSVVDIDANGQDAKLGICFVAANKVGVSYKGLDNDLYSAICTISGTTVTAGTPDEAVDAITVGNSCICSPDSTHVVIVYNETAGGDVDCVAGVFSGTTFGSWGSPVELTSSNLTNHTVFSIDSSNVCSIVEGGTNGYIYLVSLSGTTVSKVNFYFSAGLTELSNGNPSTSGNVNNTHDYALMYNDGSNTYLTVFDFVWQDGSFDVYDITGVAEDADGTIIVDGISEGDASGLDKDISYFIDTTNRGIRKKDHAFAGQGCKLRVRTLDTDALKAIGG